LREQAALELLSHIAEDETYFIRICFSNEAIFCVWKAVNRHNCHVRGWQRVKILMKLLNMNVIHQRSACGVLGRKNKQNIIVLFFFEEPTAADKTFLEKTLLYITFLQEQLSS
jgi:hypothetical protein